MAAAGSRRALVVAVGRYDDPDLRVLRGPGQDAPALARVLSDPTIGSYEVTQVVDRPHHVVAAAMEDFFADSRLDDLLLLHLSCHGVKDDDGRLYFAASDTRRRRLASSAVSAAYVNDLMDRCRARSIVVLLDCCYSGAFVAGAKGDDGVHLKERLAGHGRAVLTASNAIEYAWEGDELSGEPQASLFTAAIVDGLATGDADRDGDGAISIDELHKHVSETVLETRRAQTPLLWTFGIAGNLLIAQNPHPRAAERESTGAVALDDGHRLASGPSPVLEPATQSPVPRGFGRWLRDRPIVVAAALAVVVAALVAIMVAPWDGDDANSEGPGTGGWAVQAPVGIAVDGDGGIYVAESSANRISYFSNESSSTFAGGGSGDTSEPRDGGPADEATLAEPLGLAFHNNGELYIADRFHGTVRRVRNGTITRFAGGGSDVLGDHGPNALDAQLDHTLAVAVDSGEWVYISSSNHRVFVVDADGVIATVAGSGEAGFGGDGGPATDAALSFPAGLAVGPDDTLYIADSNNNRIRRVDRNGRITTVAGNGDADFVDDLPAVNGALNAPEGIAFDADGTLYIADTLNNRIRKVSPEGTITTVAGNGDDIYNGDGGPATQASLNRPRGVTVADDGTIYIADTGNDRIRKVSPDGTITTVG